MTTDVQVSTETRATATGACVHHWVIDAPVSMVSTGRCVNCGTQREFSNRYVEPEPGHRQPFPRFRDPASDGE